MDIVLMTDRVRLGRGGEGRGGKEVKREERGVVPKANLQCISPGSSVRASEACSKLLLAKDSRRPGDGSPSTHPPAQKVKAEFVLTGAQVNDATGVLVFIILIHMVGSVALLS